MTIQNMPVWNTNLSLGAKLLWAVNRYDRPNLNAVQGALWTILEELRSGENGHYAAELLQSGWYARQNGKLVAVIPAGEQR